MRDIGRFGACLVNVCVLIIQLPSFLRRVLVLSEWFDDDQSRAIAFTIRPVSFLSIVGIIHSEEKQK